MNIIGRFIKVANEHNHHFTCLPASPALQAAGLSVVVALESDRIPVAAFKSGDEASKWCDDKNGILPDAPPKEERTPGPIDIGVSSGLTLAQKVAAAQGKT